MALLKYKIKSVLPALVFAAVALVIFSGLLFVEGNEFTLDIEEYGTFYMNRFVNNLSYLPHILLIIAIWLGMGLTKEYGILEKENFVSSLPYKKTTRFFISVIPGIIVFVIFGLVLSICVYISHSLTYEFYSEMNMFNANYEMMMKLDGVGNALLRVWQVILSMLMIYLATFFAGVICRNKSVTVFFIVAVGICPFFIPEAINNITTGYFNNDFALNDEIITYGSLMNAFVWEELDGTMAVCFVNIKEHIATMGVLSIFYAMLSYLAAVKISRVGGKVIVNTVLEKVCIVFAGIMGAFIVPMFLGADSITLPALIIIMLAVGALICFGFNKLVSGNGKYKYMNAALILVLFLTGCGKSEDFIGQISNDANPGFKLYNEAEDITFWADSKDVSNDVAIRAREALSETFLSEYFTNTFDDEQGVMIEEEFYINSLKYLSDYALERDVQVVELPDEDRVLMYTEKESFYSRYKWVHNKELIYLENEEGYIIGDMAYLLISQSEDVKAALIENDLEMVYEVFARIDNELIENISRFEYSKTSADIFNCYVAVNPTNVYMKGSSIPYYEDAEYLTGYQKVDGFTITAMIANDDYEAVSLLYFGDFDLDAEYYNGYPKSAIRLDAFGKNEKLQELKLICHKDTDVIPELCVPTMEGYLLGLGVSEEETAQFMKALPKDSGNIGKLNYSVQSWNDYIIIKIYSK